MNSQSTLNSRRKWFHLLGLLTGVALMMSAFIPVYHVQAQDGCGINFESYRVEPAASSIMRFAVIGDYGDDNDDERDVADMVKSWNPEFIVTVGDNNYPDGEAATIDDNITQYYGDYVESGRFFPALGNHDWHAEDAQPYLDYFSLPGNERYYTFSRENVQFFILDSDRREPDGNEEESIQAGWLETEVTESTAPFKLVFMHHPPYSSGMHGSSAALQWDFAGWGVDAVVAGHDHNYERIMQDSIAYIINGLGGASRREFGEVVEGSEVRYSCDYGALLVEVNDNILVFRFITVGGRLIDTFSVPADPISG